ncbi:DUF5977 domain-containing protein [Chitinophagaceae bacterium 26-R-25]|nr:DUF5977 domain-containing protein [Chitinophagaceae bacterium 26-R-25]
MNKRFYGRRWCAVRVVGILCFAAISVIAVGQNDINVIPPPPGIADIGHYGMASAHLTDGAFTTQIPLYEYKTKNLTLPISLTYSTNGLKVDKIASRVGMDWMLNAGGSIGRMILGKDDELAPFLTVPSDFPSTTGDSLHYLMNAVNLSYESVPDIYSFNFNGNCGRFVISKGQIIKLEQNSFAITKTGTGFKIVDNNGIAYFFGNAETTNPSSSCSHVGSGESTNGWLLNEIDHPLGDTIRIFYKSCNYFYNTSVTQSYTRTPILGSGGCPTGSCPTYPTPNFQCVNKSTVKEYIIDKICSNQRGLVQFKYAAREDIPGDSAVASIEVFDATADRFGNVSYNDSLSIKAIGFGLMYIQNSVGHDVTGVGVDKRLFLESVNIGKELSSNDNRFYWFEYNNLNALPYRLCYSQDHFGFYNGRNNVSMIPSPADYGDQQGVSDFSAYGFGNRNPNGQYAAYGTLKEIHYPTGGRDTIEYEPNTIFTPGRNCNNPDQTLDVTVMGTSTLKHVTTYASAPFTLHCPQTIHIVMTDRMIDSVPNGECNANLCFQSSSGCQSLDMNAWPMQATPLLDGNYYIILNAGTYTAKLTVQGPSNGYVGFSYTDASDSLNLEEPGVRVSKIITYPDSVSQPFVKKYLYVDPVTNKSSGKAYVEHPNYQELRNVYSACSGGTFKKCSYYSYSNNNFYSLYSYGGSNIYYTNVTEMLGDNGENGKIDHQFLVAPDDNSMVVFQTIYKGAPLSNYGIYNGFETNTKYYKNTTSGFKLQKEVSNFQTDDSRLSNTHSFYGFQPEEGFNYVLSLSYNSLYDIGGINIIKYEMLSRWLRPDSTSETDYDDNGNAYLTVSKSLYNNTQHMQLSQQWTTNSKGNKTGVNYFYPLDAVTLQTTDGNTAKLVLESNHMYASLLKKQTFNESQVLEEDENDYSTSLGTTVPVLYKTYKTISNVPHLEATVSAYDGSKNIIELQQKGINSAYVWDYGNTLPIAGAKNASVNDIAFTSFEADGKGNWTFSGTPVSDANAQAGVKDYALISGSITKSGLNTSKTYVVSYWSKTGAATVNSVSATQGLTRRGWTYYEHRLPASTSSVTVSGAVTIDEVRCYPSDAQMTSFTYKPLVGMTSQNDVANNISYYEYDGINGLAVVRDGDYNILKKTCFNFRGQPESCAILYYNKLDSLSFTKSGCDTNTTIPTKLTYVVPAGKYSSYISQPYVDSLAHSELLARGQANVDSLGSCTFKPCPSCTAEGRMCINGVCVTGEKIYTSSVYQGFRHYLCTYHYYFYQNNAISQDYTETSLSPCPLN